jgi:formylglycine-generating enzyme required for sulfatase activity
LPNELGLYDMSGNLLEWCGDWYGDYYGISQTDPAGPVSGAERVLRGGSWSGGARSARVSSRNAYAPGGRRANLGFRLASDSK